MSRQQRMFKDEKYLEYRVVKEMATMLTNKTKESKVVFWIV
jgi:hypothetical protein